MGLIQMKSNKQMVEEEERAIQDLVQFEADEKKRLTLADELAGYLRRAWEDAKKEKRSVEQKILDNMKAINGEYTSSKMAEINTFGGSKIYMMLTETKCRNGEAWVKDILFQPNNIPWDIEPTPMPDLPGNMEEEITYDFMQSTVNGVLQMAAQTGAQINPDMLGQRMRAALPEIKAGAKKAIMDYAKEKAEEMKDQINDQLTEGGWYDAIDELIPDVMVKTGILKGPILRMENQRRVNLDEEGVPSLSVESVKMTQYERRPPLDIYPGPGVINFQKGYFFDKLAYTPSDIQGFLDLPGFNEKEIRAVLKECREGSLREWTSIDTERADTEGKASEMIRAWEEVDVLEFWGPVQGKTIQEWSPKLKKKAPDADKFYDINAYLIGNHVIKAIINPDPMGKRPYSKVSFIEKSGAFWGVGLPEILEDTQTACNACARALVNNVGMASGPQVVIFEEMLADFEKGDFVPWKRWWVSDDEGLMAQGKKPIEFYQPTLIAQQLISVFEFFMKQADESSGVPAYAHGDPQVGGAGNTASGLSMLMTQAARGIKLLIKNIDHKIIEDSILRQYFWNMDHKKFSGLVGDQKIVAKGSVSLIAKEQQAQRMTDLLATATQTQVMTPPETRKLLKKVFKTHELDPRDIMEDSPIPMGNMLGYTPNPGGIARPGTLNAAGEPAQGTDFQTITGRGGPASAAAPPAQ